VVLVVLGAMLASSLEAHAAVEREPMTLRVVAVNPSADKPKTIPVRFDLPLEVSPSDILDAGEMDVEFDTERSQYYVHKAEVTLAPKQTRVFSVVVRDVWFIPEQQIEALRAHTSLVMGRLKESEYRQAATQLGDSILGRLDEITALQEDEAASRKRRIGDYRRNLRTLEEIKEDLARMEKLLSFTGGVPVPEMMEESPLKSDAPSTTTTWLVIFLILIFMGLLAGQFFFTWHRRVRAAAEFSAEKQAAFPDRKPSSPGAAEHGSAGSKPSS